MTDYTVKRDRWDRPYVTTDGQPLRYNGGKNPVNATAYTRVSTLAGTLDDKAGLVDWAACNAAVGVVRDKALHAQIAHLASAHSDPWNSDAKTPLKQIVEQAQKIGGSDHASGMGTAFHGLTEIVDAGQQPEFAPEELLPWLDAYQKALSDWEIMLVEPFLVCDELQAAGSADRVLQHKVTGQIVVADIKTGDKEPQYPMKVTAQVAIYARGMRYDQQTGRRDIVGADTTTGMLIHVPIRAKQPRCDLYPLDLKTGWDIARLSVKVRQYRRMKGLKK